MATRFHSPLVWLLLAAVLVKLGYLFFALPDPSSVSRLSIDALYHYKWASLIADDHPLANTPYFRAPLYPFVLAALLKISSDSIIFVRLIQLLAGCLTLLFSYRLADRLAGRTAAIIAVLLLILYPIMTYSEAELLLDSLFALLALVCFYLLMAPRSGPPRPIGAGIVFGLAALARPTILVFLPVIVLSFLRGWKDPVRRKSGLTAAAVFLAVLVIMLTPVTIINYAASGQIIFVAYQGGINFYLGNNPEADGFSSTLPSAGRDWDLADADYLAFRETGRHLQYADQSAFWYKKGLAYIRDHPKDAAALFIRKLYFLFSGHEISNNQPLREAVFNNAFLKYLPVRLPLILSLAVLPLFLAVGKRKEMLTLYGVILGYGITVAMFFVSSRFRLPLVPLLAILAGWGAVSLGKTIRARRLGYRLFFGVIAAGLTYILAVTMFFHPAAAGTDQALFLRGNLSLRQGDYQTALARFDSLSQKQPYHKNSYLNLGITWLKLGRSNQACDAFQRELLLNPESAEAANNLAAVALLRNQPDSAFAWCARALAIEPYHADAAINLLRTYRKMTTPALRDSIENLRRTIRPFQQENPAYLFEEGLYFAGAGRLNEAIDDQLRAIRLLESNRPKVSFGFTYQEIGGPRGNDLPALIRYQLGYLYGLTGDLDQSVQYSLGAIALNPDLKEAYVNLISGYRSLGRDREADSVAGAYLRRWP